MEEEDSEGAKGGEDYLMGYQSRFLGLDTAKATGVALWDADMQVAYVQQTVGDPIQQREAIGQYLTIAEDIRAIGMESIHNFLNANTTRSLLERYGYIKYSVISSGYMLYEIPPRVARKSLGVKSKEDVYEYFSRFIVPEGKTRLTNNHTDALAIAMHVSKEYGYKVNEDLLKIYII